uniref:LamG-like jellyroll fold domain-containing protein n=1 Tax=viral metagenome TaxID=1070528 RepID=A0A6C0IXU3_9ZZZZ
MQLIKNISKKIPTQNKYFIPTVITILVLFLVIIILAISHHKKKNLENPIFFLKPKNGKKSLTINNRLLFEPKSGYDLSLTFWIYLDDWKYRFNSKKHILTKGRLEYNPKVCSPAIFLDEDINDMIVYIQKHNGLKTIKVKDITLNKWVHIGVIISSNTSDIYIDGKLNSSNILDSFPKLNHGDLHVNYFGGFAGKVSNLKYYPRVISQKEIEKLLKNGPNKGILSRFYHKLIRDEKDIEKNIKNIIDDKENCTIETKSNVEKILNIVGNQYVKLKRNNLVKKFFIKTDYDISFSIIPLGKINGWSNILHSSISNKNCCSKKDRLPGIWFRSNTTQLYIVVSTNVNPNHSFTCPKNLPLNKEAHIRLSVKATHLTLNISGSINYKKTITIDNNREKGITHLYISDPWHQSADSLIKNLIWN